MRQRTAKYFFVFFFIALFPSLLSGQNENENFDSFRSRMFEDFQNHRKRIFDDYHTFLSGVWRDYEAFRGVPSPFVAPKPVDQPRLPQDKPLPQLSTPVKPNIPSVEPGIPEEELPTPDLPTKPVTPTVKPQPVVTPAMDGVKVSFYGLNLQIPRVSLVELPSLEGRDLAAAWKQLAASVSLRQAVRDLEQKAELLALPDWFVLELVNAYAKELAGGQQSDASVLLVHYLLSSMNYDVRLGRSDKGLLLLVNMKQMVYARNFVTINDVRYYICLREGCQRLSTCDLPVDADLGQSFDLLVRQAPKIPARKKAFSVGNGQLSVSGSVDANLMEMFRHYPQMPIPCYAASSLQSDLRSSIVSQLRTQIQGLPRVEAVNALLHFVQSSFEYATDDQQFGYEKPFFLEELFYWPQCDCEDRSVLYVYLLRECLGLECHLINFPGHECAAVCLPESVEGTYYEHEGCRFYISDPTYIGADTGMCMSDYQSVSPKVEKWY